MMRLKDIAPLITTRKILVFVMILLLLFFALPELFGRLAYELQEVANWDTGLYYTVGKGITHGISPYSGLYENKPPVIFFLSALSYLLTDGFYLVNVLNVLAFLVILLVPATTFVAIGIRDKSKWNVYAGLAIFALSIMFMCYAEERSGEVQVEAFGTAALLLCFCFTALAHGRQLKFYDWRIIVSGIFLGIAAMFKEPFGLIGVVCLLFFVRSPRDFVPKILMPIVCAGLLSIVLLLLSGGLIPYFTVYWANMFGAHVSVYGSPFDRAKEVFKLFDDMRDYSRCLEATVVILLGMNIIACFSSGLHKFSPSQIMDVVFKCFRVVLIVWTASFMVGLGGPYYNHHYIFALPCYYTLFFALIVETMAWKKNCSQSVERKPELWFAVAMGSVVLSMVCFYNRDEYRPNEDVPKAIEKAKEGAAYIDAVLDALGEENYLYLGFNGHEFYAYTRHLPIGPSFTQWSLNFDSKNTFFAREFPKQMDKANVVIFKGYNTGVLSQQTLLTVDNCFTRDVPEAARDIKRPENFTYHVHFRKERDCSYFK
ncbi:MAG: hypothetical protein MJY47_08580 [Fibrobacter sp.]|nr:hypothetical protein [Fibrobacter sp.]